MKVTVKMSEDDIRKILAEYVYDKYNVSIPADKLRIEVKSKQNYKSEWELADIRMEIEVTPL